MQRPGRFRDFDNVLLAEKFAGMFTPAGGGFEALGL